MYSPNYQNREMKIALKAFILKWETTFYTNAVSFFLGKILVRVYFSREITNSISLSISSVFSNPMLL